VDEERLKKVSLQKSATLIDALRRMDDASTKLSIVLSDGKYLNLVSIGDIQRAIIRGCDLNTPIVEVTRGKVLVASTETPLEEITKTMYERRIEFMPVIDKNGCVADIHFWDELFANTQSPKERISAPVVIMAGGKGTRLKPFSNVLPKPLFPIGNHTILEEIIQRFESQGCRGFWLSLNHKAEFIRQYVDTIEDRTFNVEFIQETEPLGTAGSLHLLKGKINETFFVSNCDILIDCEYAEILDYHREHKNEITLVSALKEIKIPYGTVETGAGGELVDFREKPNLNFMINTGMYVLEPDLLKQIPENKFLHITELMNKIRDRGGKVGVFPVSEKSWLDIGEWQEYDRTLNLFSPSSK